MPFFALEGLTQAEARAENTRQFVGPGNPYLKVPGLIEVQRVRVGRLEIPLTERLEFPVDNSGTQLYRTEDPLVSLQTDADGESVLLRNTRSNDGIWQDGAPIYVTGVWGDAPEGPPEAKARK